jgi:uncharacterized protein with PIN domain
MKVLDIIAVRVKNGVEHQPQEEAAIARRICLACSGKLEKVDMRDSRWNYLQKRSYYVCEKCRKRWLYSPDLTCPVLLEKAK